MDGARAIRVQGLKETFEGFQKGILQDSKDQQGQTKKVQFELPSGKLT